GTLPVPGAGRLLAEPALSQPVVADGAEEVRAAEIRPIGFAAVELGIGALPHQEPRQPLLYGAADDEIGVGLALGVEVCAALLRGQFGDDRLEIRAVVVAGPQQGAGRVYGLLPTAVAGGDIDPHSADGTGGHCLEPGAQVRRNDL